jgi:hypothetical protein
MRPVPYPYVLLTLWLLGKLGDKNRQVLRNPINFYDSVTTLEHRRYRLTFDCVWKGGKFMSGEEGIPDSVPLPLYEYVDLLKRASFVQGTLFPDGPSSGTGMNFSWHECDKLMSCDVNVLDMEPLRMGLVGETLASEVEASLQILHTSVAKVTEIGCIR